MENYTLSNSKQQGGFSLSGLNSRFDLMFATDQTSDLRPDSGQEMRETRTQGKICVLLLLMLTTIIRKRPDTYTDTEDIISNTKLINAASQLFIPRLPF